MQRLKLARTVLLLSPKDVELLGKGQVGGAHDWRGARAVATTRVGQRVDEARVHRRRVESPPAH